MYPKVKVREEKNQQYGDFAVDRDVKNDSLSLHVSSSPENQHREDTPPYIARIPVSYSASNIDKSTIHARKEKNQVRIAEKDRSNVRATQILRPRAVLSSPDNDAAIGNKNRINAERSMALRNRNSVQNRNVQGQCKVLLPSLMNTKSAEEDTDLSSNMNNKSGQKGKEPTTAVPSQRRYVRTGKSIKT